MTMVIEESDEISFNLLRPLLASVEMKNRVMNPSSTIYAVIIPFLSKKVHLCFRIFCLFHGNWVTKSLKTVQLSSSVISKKQ